MSPQTAPVVRRLAACVLCGARRRSLSDTTQGVRAHCMGCGEEVSLPFSTEAVFSSLLPLQPAGRRG